MEDKDKQALIYAFNTLNKVHTQGYENICNLAGGMQVIRALIDGVNIEMNQDAGD